MRSNNQHHLIGLISDGGLNTSKGDRGDGSCVTSEPISSDSDPGSFLAEPWLDVIYRAVVAVGPDAAFRVDDCAAVRRQNNHALREFGIVHYCQHLRVARGCDVRIHAIELDPDGAASTTEKVGSRNGDPSPNLTRRWGDRSDLTPFDVAPLLVKDGICAAVGFDVDPVTSRIASHAVLGNHDQFGLAFKRYELGRDAVQSDGLDTSAVADPEQVGAGDGDHRTKLARGGCDAGDLALGIVPPHVVARDDRTSVTDELDLAVPSVERFRCSYHDDSIADDLKGRGNLNPTK